MENSVQMRSFWWIADLSLLSIKTGYARTSIVPTMKEFTAVLLFFLLGRSIFPPFLQVKVEVWIYFELFFASPLPPPRLQALPRLVLIASGCSSLLPSLLSPNLLNQVISGHTLQSSVWVLDWPFMLQFMLQLPHLLSIFQKMVC